MRTKTVALLCSAIILALGQSFAQTDKALLRELAQENTSSIEALVLYPEDARLAILETAKYPEVLIKMQGIRDKTGAAFRAQLENLPRSSQEILYDLSRYPGLIAELVAHKNDRMELFEVLKQIPENDQVEALAVVESEMNSLIEINALNQAAQGAFDELITRYPAPAQAAFRTLLGLPEVLDILNEDLRFTILVGDVYTDDPAWVIQKMDSLSLVVAREHAEELENWKKNLENDPQARQELQAATQEYADEYGYTDEVYDIVNDDLYAEDNVAPQTVYVERYYFYNYPYWFGYPWWQPQPCWRPYPDWWYWGFYPYRNTVVIVHLPSFHFINWYFYHPYHHHAYNHLSTHFVNHYYGHRKSGSTISMGVGAWHKQNRNLISDDWLADKQRLPARLKEYARFEQQREKFNDKNPTRTQSREEFLEKNPAKYPDLNRSRMQAQVEIQREDSNSERKRLDWTPPKTPNKAEPAPVRPPRTEQPTPIKQAPKQEPPARRTIKVPDIDKARDYHRDKWQEPKQPAKPKTQPVPLPKTKPSTAPPRVKSKPKSNQESPRKAPAPKKREGGGN
jgi:hypothetical protein